MKFTTTPNRVINRGWDRLIANAEGILETTNETAIKELKGFLKEVVIAKPKTKWKSETKK